PWPVAIGGSAPMTAPPYSVAATTLEEVAQVVGEVAEVFPEERNSIRSWPPFAPSPGGLIGYHPPPDTPSGLLDRYDAQDVDELPEDRRRTDFRLTTPGDWRPLPNRPGPPMRASHGIKPPSAGAQSVARPTGSRTAATGSYEHPGPERPFPIHSG